MILLISTVRSNTTVKVKTVVKQANRLPVHSVFQTASLMFMSGLITLQNKSVCGKLGICESWNLWEILFYCATVALAMIIDVKLNCVVKHWTQN